MYFDEIAAKWDDDRRCERARILSEEIKRVWNGKPEAVLDFGCGTGLLTYALSSCATELYGYDTSAEMQKVFLLKQKKYGLDHVHLVTDEERKQMTFDVIFSSMVLHHIEDVKAKIMDLKRSLVPDGIFVWIDLDEEDGTFHKGEFDFHGHNGFAREEVKNMLQGCGFYDVSIKTVYQGEKMSEGKPVAYSLFLAVACENAEITDNIGPEGVR